MSITEIIAVYAALLSSLLFLWEIYKHFTRGAKIRLEVSKDTVLIPDPIEEGKLWVRVTATNLGDQTTILKSLSFRFFNEKIFKRKFSNKAYFVPNNPAGESLPKKLQPGDQWTGVIAQIGDEFDLSNLEGLMKVQIELYASHRTKPHKKVLR